MPLHPASAAFAAHPARIMHGSIIGSEVISPPVEIIAKSDETDIKYLPILRETRGETVDGCFRDDAIDIEYLMKIFGVTYEHIQEKMFKTFPEHVSEEDLKNFRKVAVNCRRIGSRFYGETCFVIVHVNVINGLLYDFLEPLSIIAADPSQRIFWNVCEEITSTLHMYRDDLINVDEPAIVMWRVLKALGI